MLIDLNWFDCLRHTSDCKDSSSASHQTNEHLFRFGNAAQLCLHCQGHIGHISKDLRHGGDVATLVFPSVSNSMQQSRHWVSVKKIKIIRVAQEQLSVRSLYVPWSMKDWVWGCISRSRFYYAKLMIMSQGFLLLKNDTQNNACHTQRIVCFPFRSTCCMFVFMNPPDML